MRAELIGRDDELAKLKAALTQVLQGQGQIVTLIGEAGVGKSRLVAELKGEGTRDEGRGRAISPHPSFGWRAAASNSR